MKVVLLLLVVVIGVQVLMVMQLPSLSARHAPVAAQSGRAMLHVPRVHRPRDAPIGLTSEKSNEQRSRAPRQRDVVHRELPVNFALSWDSSGHLPTIAEQHGSLANKKQQIEEKLRADIVEKKKPNVRKVVYREFEQAAGAPEVTVLVMWRETVSMTMEVLNEVLQDDTIPIEVLYVHLDMPYYESVLGRVRGLQERHDNLHLITVRQWMMRYQLYEMVLPMIQTRFVMSHDNNNILVPYGWLDLLTRAMKVREDGPIMIAPEIQAIDQRKTLEMKDHHAMMMIGQTIPWEGSNATSNVMWWAGVGDNTVIAELDRTYDLVVGDMIELHSFMIDLQYINPEDYGKLAEYSTWPTYHFELGLHMWRTYGYGSVGVLEGLEYAYNLPRSHMVLSDVPMSMVAWNAWDALWTTSYVEEKYGCVYHHEGGYDWHMRMAFHDSEWTVEDTHNDSISNDPVLIASLLVSLYGVHHATHGTATGAEVPYHLINPVSQSVFHRSQSLLQQANTKKHTQHSTLRTLLVWIAEHSTMVRQFWEQSSTGLFLDAIQRRVHTDHNQRMGHLPNINATRKWFREEVAARMIPKSDPRLGHVYEMMKPQKQANRLNWTLGQKGFIWIVGVFIEEVHRVLVDASSAVLRTTDDGPMDYFHYIIVVPSSSKYEMDFGATLELCVAEDDAPFHIQAHYPLHKGKSSSFIYPPRGDVYQALLPLVLPRRTVLVKWGKRSTGQVLFRSTDKGPVRSWEELLGSLMVIRRGDTENDNHV